MKNHKEELRQDDIEQKGACSTVDSKKDMKNIPGEYSESDPKNMHHNEKVDIIDLIKGCWGGNDPQDKNEIHTAHQTKKEDMKDFARECWEEDLDDHMLESPQIDPEQMHSFCKADWKKLIDMKNIAQEHEKNEPDKVDIFGIADRIMKVDIANFIKGCWGYNEHEDIEEFREAQQKKKEYMKNMVRDLWKNDPEKMDVFTRPDPYDDTSDSEQMELSKTDDQKKKNHTAQLKRAGINYTTRSADPHAYMLESLSTNTEHVDLFQTVDKKTMSCPPKSKDLEYMSKLIKELCDTDPRIMAIFKKPINSVNSSVDQKKMDRAAKQNKQCMNNTVDSADPDADMLEYLTTSEQVYLFQTVDQKKQYSTEKQKKECTNNTLDSADPDGHMLETLPTDSEQVDLFQTDDQNKKDCTAQQKKECTIYTIDSAHPDPDMPESLLINSGQVKLFQTDDQNMKDRTAEQKNYCSNDTIDSADTDADMLESLLTNTYQVDLLQTDDQNKKDGTAQQKKERTNDTFDSADPDADMLESLVMNSEQVDLSQTGDQKKKDRTAEQQKEYMDNTIDSADPDAMLEPLPTNSEKADLFQTGLKKKKFRPKSKDLEYMSKVMRELCDTDPRMMAIFNKLDDSVNLSDE